MQTYRGIQAGPGIASGRVFIHNPSDLGLDYRRLADADVEPEIDRFRDALAAVRVDLQAIQEEVRSKLGGDHAQIFEALAMMLDDPSVIDPTETTVRERKVNVEYAFWQTLQQLRRRFDAIDNEYILARKADILDIETRVLSKLGRRVESGFAQLADKAVVVAHDLTPSDIVQIDRKRVLGIITEVGGSTSHAAIIARGLEIPAVVGVESAMSAIDPSDRVILDGHRGLVYVNPDAETTSRYEREASQHRENREGLTSIRDLPAETLDGHRVSVQANIELPEEAESSLAYGAEGIGLYRTEYLYLTSSWLPTEDEQFAAYEGLAKRMSPHSLVIRTLDLGGDKLSYVLNTMPEMNPFMGWRAIRLSLAHRGLFRAQLRAILRASAHGNVKVMFPMISSLEELREAKAVLQEARNELKSVGVDFDPDCPVGAMIEVPSAALVADELAEEVDFFSIGTNDLVQYTLAVDRGNEKVAYLFDPLHPAVLRLIRMVVEAGHRHNIPVTLCGEMAADPCAGVLLLGMGVDGFSTSPMKLPEVKRLIRSFSLSDAQAIAETALSKKTRQEVRKTLLESLPASVRDALPEGGVSPASEEDAHLSLEAVVARESV